MVVIRRLFPFQNLWQGINMNIVEHIIYRLRNEIVVIFISIDDNASTHQKNSKWSRDWHSWKITLSSKFVRHEPFWAFVGFRDFLTYYNRLKNITGPKIVALWVKRLLNCHKMHLVYENRIPWVQHSVTRRISHKWSSLTRSLASMTTVLGRVGPLKTIAKTVSVCTRT